MSDWAENGLNPAFSFWNELFYVRRTSEGNYSWQVYPYNIKFFGWAEKNKVFGGKTK